MRRIFRVIFVLFVTIIVQACAGSGDLPSDENEVNESNNEDISYKLTAKEGDVAPFIGSEFDEYVFVNGEERDIYYYGDDAGWNWTQVYVIGFGTIGSGTISMSDDPDMLGWFEEYDAGSDAPASGLRFTFPIKIFSPTEGEATIRATNFGGVSVKENTFNIKLINERNFYAYYSYVIDEDGNDYNFFKSVGGIEFNVYEGIQEAYSECGIDFSIINSTNPRVKDGGESHVYNSSNNWDYIKLAFLTWYQINLNGDKIVENSDPYTEIISIAAASGCSKLNNLGGYTISFFNETSGDFTYSLSWVFENKTIGEENSELRLKSRAFLLAHELGHSRGSDFRSNFVGTQDEHHDVGHNGRNNMTCIMTSLDRTGMTNDLLEDAVVALKFCDGHKQKLYNIDWVYFYSF